MFSHRHAPHCFGLPIIPPRISNNKWTNPWVSQAWITTYPLYDASAMRFVKPASFKAYYLSRRTMSPTHFYPNADK